MIRPAASHPLSTEEAIGGIGFPLSGYVFQHRARPGIQLVVEEPVGPIQTLQRLEGSLQTPPCLIRADDLQLLGGQHAPHSRRRCPSAWSGRKAPMARRT